jgi:hypothetical protein
MPLYLKGKIFYDFFLHKNDIEEKTSDGKAEQLMVIFGAHLGVDAIE